MNYPLLTEQAIHDKIQSLGFKDCQVVVSTVDSLESMNGGIIIQVLGELSNAGEPSQKFAQTIFLAPSQPPTGYFVLNNIFKYLKEDIDSDLDAIEPDSANEIETALPHEDQPSSGDMTNGFHNAMHVSLDEEHPHISTALPPTPVPVNSLASPKVDGQETLYAQSEIPEIPPREVTEKTSTSVEGTPALPLDSTVPESKAAEEEPTRPDDTTRSPPEDTTASIEPILSITNPASSTIKTWATMAATNSEKWQSQAEQKANYGAVSHPKTSGNQGTARKETPKIPQQGPFYSLSYPFTNIWLEKQEPALGYIKYVGPKVQKSALNDALVKFGTLKDLDINRQKVSPR